MFVDHIDLMQITLDCPGGQSLPIVLNRNRFNCKSIEGQGRLKQNKTKQQLGVYSEIPPHTSLAYLSPPDSLPHDHCFFLCLSLLQTLACLIPFPSPSLSLIFSSLEAPWFCTMQVNLNSISRIFRIHVSTTDQYQHLNGLSKASE